MTQRWIKRGLTNVGRCFFRHVGHLHSLQPLQAIGVVEKVFPQRGYGFLLMLSPPASWFRASFTDKSGTSQLPMDAAAPLSPSNEECVSVWFPLTSSGGTGPQVSDVCRKEKSSNTLKVSPGCYVKFSATAHYDDAKALYVWRTREVVPCDPFEELKVVLQRARDTRWDNITLEDVERGKRRVVEWHAQSSAQLVDVHVTHEGNKVHHSPPWNISETHQQFIVRQSDLQRPFDQSLSHKLGRGDGGDEVITELGSSRLRSQADENRKRWERVMQLLNEKSEFRCSTAQGISGVDDKLHVGDVSQSHAPP
ncbi:hypothetical protein DPX39_000024100 [Trypanosoma brucei equiperdum]|uniref:Uncharacterized protein n=1 Tax=Trypanosoma brucei equiperdum TaxID=630700 RepID=A0A3L6KT56_9TRYP|nr:hypothetical protein DPX39_000024100 [Trypanosoma brucei equiperdum]